MQSYPTDLPVYIDSDEKLAEFCEQWKKNEILALDTEFIRTDTFYPKGALIQVSDGYVCYLIDPLVINDLSPFQSILNNTTITKVLHSCSEDLEVFDRLFDALPKPLIDTQLAAALDGHGFSLSYQKLVESLLNVHVPKGETRSNWLQRPLTESQIHYAMLDVAYLPSIYKLLFDSLKEKGRLTWLVEECDLLVDRFSDTGGINQYFQKIKSSWKLPSKNLYILQELTCWREWEARKRDIPRGRVLKDRSCYEIARLIPSSLEELSDIEDIKPAMVRKDGDTILGLLNETTDKPSSNFPKRLPKPLPPESGKHLKLLKAHVRERAENLRLAPEMLVRKRDYESLLRSGFNNSTYQLPETLSGWRKQVVGDALLALLHGNDL